MRTLAIFCLLLFVTAPACLAGKTEVISLSPSITKMIYELGGEQQLLAYTSYCDEVKGDQKPVVASHMNVNTEKILSLSPDMVITTNLTAERSVRALRSVGIEVVVLEMPESFGALCEQLIDVGRLTGHEETAIKMVNDQQARLEKLRGMIPEGHSPRVFMQLGAKPLFTVTPGTFLNDYIELAGGENIAAGMTHGSITREVVLARDPEVIFIVMTGAAGREEMRNWKTYQGLSAAVSEKVFLLDEDDAASPTPAIFLNILEEVIRQIYY